MEYVRDYMSMRTEFQTLQRLQKSNHIFFTCVSLSLSLSFSPLISAAATLDLSDGDLISDRCRVRSYVDRLQGLEQYPGGAQAVAAAIRRKYKGMMHYMGVGSTGSLKAMVGYLDQITEGNGLAPGLLGRVVEPWERDSMEDGTFAAETERLLRSASPEELEEIRLETAKRKGA